MIPCFQTKVTTRKVKKIGECIMDFDFLTMLQNSIFTANNFLRSTIRERYFFQNLNAVLGKSALMRNSQKRRKRALSSREYLIEILVVADSTMLDYYKRELEQYILSLFNTVSFFCTGCTFQFVLTVKFAGVCDF